MPPPPPTRFVPVTLCWLVHSNQSQSPRQSHTHAGIPLTAVLHNWLPLRRQPRGTRTSAGHKPGAKLGLSFAREARRGQCPYGEP